MKRPSFESLSRRWTTLYERLQLRYNVRREYFTIALPVVLALLIVGAALLLGFASPAGGEVEVQDERMAAYEELLRQMEEEEAKLDPGETDSEEPASGEPVSGPGFDHILVYAGLIAITPYAVDVTLQKRQRRRKEELYTEFLFKLSEMMRGGLDPVKSVTELARTDLGALSPHVRYAANSMKFGISFEESMRDMAKSLRSELIIRYTDLVVQSSYSGGSVSDLILRASEDMRSILSIEREKEGNLSQYTLIFYFAQAIIVYIVYALHTSLLPFFSDISTSSFLDSHEIAEIDFSTGFFHLIMLNGLFGGLIIGKITEGEARYGLKHVVVLVAACYVVCSLTLLAPPADVGVGNIRIEILSGGGQESFVNFPIKEPIVARITDPEGNPLQGIVVEFSISPGGTPDPSAVRTNSDGIAKTAVTLGNIDGTHTITVTAEKETTMTTVIANSAEE
ncbi:MAG: type II secretion system F family protein [Methanomicrobiaceae archaeon]|nr:type II secretion system F family protein [Methanomicrobiaceae archaeon]